VYHWEEGEEEEEEEEGGHHSLPWGGSGEFLALLDAVPVLQVPSVVPAVWLPGLLLLPCCLSCP